MAINKNKSNNLTTKIIISLVVCIVVVSIVLIIWCICRKCINKSNPQRTETFDSKIKKPLNYNHVKEANYVSQYDETNRMKKNIDINKEFEYLKSYIENS